MVVQSVAWPNRQRQVSARLPEGVEEKTEVVYRAWLGLTGKGKSAQACERG